MARPRWSDWEPIRRQVTLCGRVLSVAPLDTVEVVAERGTIVQSATLRHDGIYYFLDLPPGDYTVTVRSAQGEVNGGVGHVSRTAEGNVSPAAVDIDIDLDRDAATSEGSAVAGRRRRKRSR